MDEKKCEIEATFQSYVLTRKLSAQKYKVF